MDRYESKFIEDIVGEIRRLIPKFVYVGANIIGMYDNLKQVKLLIEAKSNEVWLGSMGLVGLVKLPLQRLSAMICWINLSIIA